MLGRITHPLSSSSSSSLLLLLWRRQWVDWRWLRSSSLSSSVSKNRKFVDTVRIRVKSGDGGKGCLSHFLLSGSYKKRPDGGNGGHGGSIILMADENAQTLHMSLHHYAARNGTNGSSQQKNGRNGPHTIIRVPCGVLVQRISHHHSPSNNYDENDDDDDFETENVHSIPTTRNNDSILFPNKTNDTYNNDKDDMVSFDDKEDDTTIGEENYDDDDDVDEKEEEGSLEEEEKDDKSIESVINTGRKAKDGMYYWKSPEDIQDNTAFLGLDYEDPSRNSDGGYEEVVTTLADLDRPGSYVVVAQGGRGGYGNAIFGKRQYPNSKSKKKKQQNNNALTMHQRQVERAMPEEGEIVHLQLELKLIADVGLIGQPNAGKSTLLAAMSKAKPKIAPYPFTTLHPLVGCIEYHDGHRVLAADVPGLIEGASTGKGKGLDFLKHLERTKALLYMVDASQPHNKAQQDIQILLNEIASYENGILLSRPALIVANKCDLLPHPNQRDQLLSDIATTAEQAGIHFDGHVFGISAGVTGEGLRPLSKAIRTILQQQQQPP